MMTDGASPAPLYQLPSSAAAHSSCLRAWFYLVWLSIARQARMREMVWIALACSASRPLSSAFSPLRHGWDCHNCRTDI